MITDDDIFTAAEDVLGVMILARRSDLDIWQTVKPAALGFDADSWIKFSGKVVRAFKYFPHFRRLPCRQNRVSPIVLES
jgi:hypothetical protein